MLKKQEKRIRRHKKVRAKIKGADKALRLCVFRSNKYIYAQIVDDEKSKTLASAKSGLSKAEKAGEDIAKKAKELKIEKVVFDRGGYKYHGRVKALADAARKGGLKF
jgi:large subunit ribosomal protein L18